MLTLMDRVENSLRAAKRNIRIRHFEHRNSRDVSAAYNRVLMGMLVLDGAANRERPVAVSHDVILEGFGKLAGFSASDQLRKLVKSRAAGYKTVANRDWEPGPLFDLRVIDVLSLRWLHTYAALDFRRDALALLLAFKTFNTANSKVNEHRVEDFRDMLKARVSPEYLTGALEAGLQDLSLVAPGFVDDIPFEYLLAA